MKEIEVEARGMTFQALTDGPDDGVLSVNSVCAVTRPFGSSGSTFRPTVDDVRWDHLNRPPHLRP